MKFFVNEELIPNDGSREVLKNLQKDIAGQGIEIKVFPDIHYKKGSDVTNGLLTASDDKILTSMLGVTNCGFTFGKIDSPKPLDDDGILKLAEGFSLNLESYSTKIRYSKDYVIDEFVGYAMKEIERNPLLAEKFDIRNEGKVRAEFERLIPAKIIKAAQVTLGTLGGGNHFFEIQKVQNVYEKNEQLEKNDYVYLLHSDSIAVGNLVQIYYSNLNELWYLTGLRKYMSIILYRLRQLTYFSFKTKALFFDFSNTWNLIFGRDKHRVISVESQVGKDLMKAYFFASVFGEMNRDNMVRRFFELSESESEVTDMRYGSHSHDSIDVEQHDGKSVIVQRNGVQGLKNSEIFALPGALGTESFLMLNSKNDEAFCSSNHGVGRILDKHIAKKAFSDEETEEKLSRKGIKIFRVGSGKISEQDPDAFKDVSLVVAEMEAQKLGKKFAKLLPVCSLKG